MDFEKKRQISLRENL